MILGDISNAEFNRFFSFITDEFKELKEEIKSFRDLLGGLVTRSEFESQEFKIKELQKLMREAEKQTDARFKEVERYTMVWSGFWKWTRRVLTAVLIGVAIALLTALLNGWLKV